jgi:Tfp pilus assembly protein PilF
MSVSSLSAADAEASITEARQHLAKQDYAKAFAVIEKNLANDKASIEMLTIGSQVAWSAGETITAAHAVSALLKRDKDASAEIYYLGAQIARAIGDYTIAAARYSRFAQM